MFLMRLRVSPQPGSPFCVSPPQASVLSSSAKSVRQLVEDIETYLAERNLERALAKQTGKTD